MTLKTTLLAASMAVLFAPPTLAHEHSINGVSVIHPMAFETSKTAKAGAGYMAITNDNEEADRLLEVKADFPRVMLHTTEEKDGIAKMIHLEAIDIPAGDTVLLEPGGLHVMFKGLDGDPLEEGEEIPATLVFENAGELEVVFKVEKRHGEAKSHDHSDHSDHSGHSTN